MALWRLRHVCGAFFRSRGGTPAMSGSVSMPGAMYRQNACWFFLSAEAFFLSHRQEKSSRVTCGWLFLEKAVVCLVVLWIILNFASLSTMLFPMARGVRTRLSVLRLLTKRAANEGLRL